MQKDSLFKEVFPFLPGGCTLFCNSTSRYFPRILLNANTDRVIENSMDIRIVLTEILRTRLDNKYIIWFFKLIIVLICWMLDRNCNITRGINLVYQCLFVMNSINRTLILSLSRIYTFRGFVWSFLKYLLLVLAGTNKQCNLNPIIKM